MMRLTSREQEIVSILKKNPLISQEELADIFGITRSSVAVHISNLMKKGIIRGKGYVFNEGASITIVGECSLDIYINQVATSSPFIDMKYNVVPLELCRVFSNYGIKPKVLTFLGTDEIGEIFLKEMQNLELDTATIIKLANNRSTRRVYINNNLTFAEELLEADYYKAVNTREWLVLNCDWLITEFRFSEDIVKRLLNKSSDEIPALCTYIVGNNAEDIPDYLSYFTIVVLGVNNIQDNQETINKLLELNNNEEQVFVITDGKSEIIVINDNIISSFPLLPNQTFNIDDKIPSFLAGLICGILNKHPLRQAIRIAVGSI